MKFRVVSANFIRGTFDTLKEAIAFAEKYKIGVQIEANGIDANTVYPDRWALIGSNSSGKINIIEKYKILM